ncbi:hypothetical protein RN001_002479 [Aquatica leii]|uniref:Bestrophin homolog n=1 Tax=Aquatica leii TaxID=1421715 RepID=A0AAN7PHA1_9COLE|nr:hypothetical protein RN001_002479 [Aquatica leii]
MTVTYTAEVATCTGFGPFLHLLRRWRGSIYKLVWLDLLLYLVCYYSLNLIYRLLLNEEQQLIFESIVDYCKEYSTLIPLSFVLGFYVNVVMTRWWNQYISIPRPDSLAVFVSSTVHGQDERGRLLRRTIMRYACVCVTMTFTMISPRVKKRFPTLGHFVEAGLLQPGEKEIIEDLNQKFPKYSKHWLPLVWAASIITGARKEGRVRDDFAVKTMLDELNKFRSQCGSLISYDTISIPLVYTQVVTLAVYTYFLTTLMGHQWVKHAKSSVDIYFPVFTTLQFFFYVGWLKVAETLINPFGDDDDDFEVNWMVDRNLQVSYLIVDEIHHDHPELVRDQYWDEVFPQELPYTLASEPFREHHPLPSTANIKIKDDESELFIPSSLKIDDLQYDDMHSAINFTAKPGSLRRSGSSRISMGRSVPDAIHRVNTVAGRLKRLFSTKEDSRDHENKTESTSGSVAELAQSNPTLNPKIPRPGSMRISDQVIQEVDEQLTVTQQKIDEPRPTVMNLFGPPPPSQPVPVPSTNNSPFEFPINVRGNISQSAPTRAPLTPKDMDFIDNISIGSVDAEGYDDEFARLKNLREQERRSRAALNYARSISSRSEPTDTDLLLLERRPSSRKSTDDTAHINV